MKIKVTFKILDYGDFYKLEVEDKRWKITTQGFHNKKELLKIIKEEGFFDITPKKSLADKK